MWGRSLSFCGGVLRPFLLSNFRALAKQELKVMVGCASRLGAARALCSEARAPSALESGFSYVSTAELCTPRDDPLAWEDGVDSEDKRELSGNAFVKYNIGELVGLLRQENAKDICVIHLPLEMKYTEYLVIASASSTRHLYAMAEYILKMYKQLNDQRNTQVRIEGRDTEDWQCIDFGNIIVHFMLPETREIYELEKLWTLRCFDDQLNMMTSEKLPEDFIFGLHGEESALEEGLDIEQITLKDGVQDKNEVQ